ncbi:MAG: M20/M25/M40 family metallo-hydrolase [Myxococcota bacterium]
MRWMQVAAVMLGACLSGCGDDEASSSATEGGTGSSGGATSTPNPDASTSSDAAGTAADASTTTTTTGAAEDDSSTGTPDVPDGPDVPEVDCSDFPSSIDEASLAEHLAALQAIADEHGNRSVGTPGYQASATYVRMRLEAAGYTSATDQSFEATVFEQLGPSTLAADDGAPYPEQEAYFVARYSGSGSITAPVVPVDLDLGLENQSTSGCQAEDFDGFPPGAIALIQRGSCAFIAKATRARDAGASAVIIFNQGNTVNRLDAIAYGLDPAQSNLPSIGASYAVGEALANAGEVTLTIDAVTEERTTRNVLVERTGTDPDQVVMFGAHLDSVPEGPGINDNGTGSMAMLAIAERLAQCDPSRTVRFAWWGAEEIGLVGSQHYVDTLSDEDRDALLFYLNFDMIGSPNFVRFVHDGDGSRYGNEGAPGSDALEQFFHDHFEALDLPIEEAPFDGRSDYGPFLNADIPTGGLATGAEVEKTQQQANLYGGEAGLAYDPCYHRACDVDATIALEEYARITAAVATAVDRFGLQGDGLFSMEAPRPRALRAEPTADTYGCGHGLRE